MISECGVHRTRLTFGMIIAVLVWMAGAVRGAAQGNGTEQRWVQVAYDKDNGLATGEANAVLQTEDGYIWIGSYGGLLRYDGANFRNFSTEEDGLNSASVRALYQDPSGRLFIGTNDKGVYMYENGVFSEIPYEEDESAFYSVRSFAAVDGVVYAGTTSGLAKITEDTESGGLKLSAVEGSMGHTVYDLACDAQGVLWACSDYGELLLIRDDEVFAVADSTKWMDGECYCVMAASDGDIYVGGSRNEAVRIAVKSSDYETGPDVKSGDYETGFDVRRISLGDLTTVNAMYEDSSGLIWLLADNGVGCIEEGAVVMPAEMKTVSSACCMIEDYEGNLWMASAKMGVIYFYRGKYYNYNDIGELDNVAVNAIVREGNFSYIGTDEGLVILDEDYRRVENALTEALELCRVRHITCTGDGILWFSLYGNGLGKYDPESGDIRIFTSEEDGLLSNSVRLTLELRDGTLAVAGSGGIDILEKDTVIRSYGPDVLPYPFILCMFEMADGTLVAGSDGMGIYAIKDSGVEQYYKADGLESGVVMRMAPDADAAGLWISAGSELYFWDADGLRKVAFRAGVGSILDIQVIGHEIWMTKSSGVFIADRDGLLEGKQEVKELTSVYGLTGTLTANSWNWLDENGALWLCTSSGVSIIDTESIPVNDAAPKGAVTMVTVDEKAYGASEEITVLPSARRVTFDIAVMSYTPGEKTIEYYLEGFEEEKTAGSVSDIPGVSYTNLDGGDYVFHMTVYNEDGVEGMSCSVPIHKEYHLWENPWFKWLLTAAAAAVIALIFRVLYWIKLRNLKLRQAEYRSIIEQALHTFASAIDAKDKDTNGHSVRVASYSKELARRMKLSAADQENIYYMALLHDIGKIGIPDSILKKQGKLTEEEWEIVRSHPAIGGEILKNFTAIPGIADGAKYHHEFYNGKGYCEGLAGEEIPLLARIIAVADAFDAMCSKRYYSDGNTIEYARQELVRCSGTQFDPDAAKQMIAMIDDGFAEQVMQTDIRGNGVV